MADTKVGSSNIPANHFRLLLCYTESRKLNYISWCPLQARVLEHNLVLVLSKGSLAGVPELEVSYVRQQQGERFGKHTGEMNPGSSGAALAVSGIQFPVSLVPKNGKQWPCVFFRTILRQWFSNFTTSEPPRKLVKRLTVGPHSQSSFSGSWRRSENFPFLPNVRWCWCHWSQHTLKAFF